MSGGRRRRFQATPGCIGTNLDQNSIAPALYGRAWIAVVWQRCCWRRFKQPFTLIGLRKRRIDRYVALHHQKVGTAKNGVKLAAVIRGISMRPKLFARITNGCADNMSGTSEVPQLADPLCATRKSAEMVQSPNSAAHLRDSCRSVGPRVC